MKASVEASIAFMEASTEDMEASIKKNTASTEASVEVVEDAAGVTSTEASTEAYTKASTEVLPRKLPRIRKLPRKHFHRFLGFSAMEASGSFHGRSEVKRLSPKLPRKLSVKAFEVASTKSWKPHPRKFTFYFHGSFRSFHRISAVSTTAPTDIFALYTAVPPVELTTFSTSWLTHTVYETKGVLPYIGCCVSLV